MSQTFDQLYIKYICDTVPMSAWGRVKYSNTLAVMPAILLGAVFGEYGALRGYVLTRHALAVLLLSCACGIALSYSAFYLRAQISATAFTVRAAPGMPRAGHHCFSSMPFVRLCLSRAQVVGILCKLGSVLISSVVSDQHASPRSTAALLVCLLAGSAYRSAPLRAAAAASKDDDAAEAAKGKCKQ